MAESVPLSISRLRPYMLRLAPWAAGCWLIVFLALFVQPCCFALAVQAAGNGQVVASLSRLDSGAQQRNDADDCRLDQGSSQVLPDQTSSVIRLKLKPPQGVEASAIWPSAATLGSADRIAKTTRPPDKAEPVYLSTQRLRI